MTNVIPMFVTDEITGLKVPNRPSKPEFIIVDEKGLGISIHKTYQEALAALYRMIDNPDFSDEVGIIKM